MALDITCRKDIRKMSISYPAFLLHQKKEWQNGKTQRDNIKHR
jgi:hypothetical protein